MNPRSVRQFKAFVLGATGLVGREVVSGLLAADRFSSVTAFVRRPGALKKIGIPESPKLIEHQVDFSELGKQPINWFQTLAPGDEAVLFSALGTTIKQAGSKEQQYLVDFTYQFEVAKEFTRVTSEQKLTSHYVLVSASGANSKSLLFYLRIKGQLEEAVHELELSQIVILRPSLLLGKRETKRLGESTAERFFELIQKMGVSLPPSIRPIHAKDVAKQALRAVTEDTKL